MKKVALFVLLVIFWVVMLFPKILLWDYFVEEMQAKDISVVAKEVDIKLWLVYNEISIKNLTVLKSFKADSLHVKQSLLNPLHVEFSGVSEYGDFKGDINLNEQKGFVLFEDTDLKKAIFRSYFKKQKDGMKYEFTY